MDLRIVTITAKDTHEARVIARALLDKKLIACANIHAGVQSLYAWKGTVADEQEAVISAKTVASKIPDIEECVRELSSYECPCIISVTVESANSDYACWLREAVNWQ